MTECILVLERETGEIDILSDRRALLGHVSEFFDILDKDFLYVDLSGSAIEFDKRYLNRGDEQFIQRRPLTPPEIEACLTGMRRGLAYHTTEGEACLNLLQDTLTRLAGT